MGKWLYLSLQQTSLFSLRPSATTSSGGLSLLLPTPFAIKMAILDIHCRLFGVFDKEDSKEFEAIRDLIIRIKPPKHISVSGGLMRILRPKRGDAAPDTPPYIQTIGYREYIHWAGEMVIAFGTIKGKDFPAQLEEMLFHLNYLGKRGGFIQPMKIEYGEDPNESFGRPYVPNEPRRQGFIIQPLDDMGEDITFEKINPYSTKTLKISDKERKIVPVRLPLKLRRASPKVKVYVRTED